MTSKKLTNVAKGTASNDAVTKNQLDTKLSLSGGLMTCNLDMNSNRIYTRTKLAALYSATTSLQNSCTAKLQLFSSILEAK